MQGDWASAGQLLGKTASKLQTAGADFIVICTNTMHKVVQEIEGSKILSQKLDRVQRLVWSPGVFLSSRQKDVDSIMELTPFCRFTV